MAVTNYYTVNGEIIAEHTAGQSRLDYVTDGLGSVVTTVDQTLPVQSTGRYKPFGANMATTGAQPLLGWMGSWGFARTSNTHADIYALPATYSSAEGVWTSEPQMSSQHLDDTYYAFLHRNPVAQNRSLKLPSTLGEGRSSPPICTKLGANCKAVWFTCYSDKDDKSQEHGVAVYCDGSKPADSVKKCCGPKGCRVRCANMKAFCESATCQGAQHTHLAHLRSLATKPYVFTDLMARCLRW